MSDDSNVLDDLVSFAQLHSMTQREQDAIRAVYNAARNLTSRPEGVRTGDPHLFAEMRFRREAFARLVEAVEEARMVLR